MRTAEVRHERIPHDKVWLVVPAYNEGERLINTLQTLTGRYGNIVVVDDGSRDDTGKLAIERTGAWVLQHSVNSGQGAALQTGIDFAIAEGYFDKTATKCVIAERIRIKITRP